MHYAAGAAVYSVEFVSVSSVSFFFRTGRSQGFAPQPRPNLGNIQRFKTTQTTTTSIKIQIESISTLLIGNNINIYI